MVAFGECENTTHLALTEGYQKVPSIHDRDSKKSTTQLKGRHRLNCALGGLWTFFLMGYYGVTRIT